MEALWGVVCITEEEVEHPYIVLLLLDQASISLSPIVQECTVVVPMEVMGEKF